MRVIYAQQHASSFRESKRWYGNKFGGGLNCVISTVEPIIHPTRERNHCSNILTGIIVKNLPIHLPADARMLATDRNVATIINTVDQVFVEIGLGRCIRSRLRRIGTCHQKKRHHQRSQEKSLRSRDYASNTHTISKEFYHDLSFPSTSILTTSAISLCAMPVSPFFITHAFNHCAALLMDAVALTLCNIIRVAIAVKYKFARIRFCVGKRRAPHFWRNLIFRRCRTRPMSSPGRRLHA